jgi:hypothetical protein
LLKKKAPHQILELKAVCPVSKKNTVPEPESSQVLEAEQQETSPHEHQVPEDVLNILQQFDHLFQEPTGLPPSRPYDHQIPLVSGAQPMNVRPYRYAPVQKTEIERQVQEMLASGII